MDQKSNEKTAPDGGFGWCVCAAACVTQFILAGVENSFGVLFIYILDEFGAGKADSAWVGSIHQGFLYILAPFVTMAADLWGCRMTSLVGGILCVAGLGASSFATRVYHLFLAYGVVFGTGACFVFITTYRAISLWFKRHLALVNGICTAGQYSGTIVFSQVIQLVVEQKGLSGTFRILAGIASVMVFIALVYRQPPDTPGGTSPEKLCVKPKDIFDFSLLKDKSFFIFLLGTSLYAFGSYVPATHAPAFSRETGVSKDKAPFLLIAWSISSFFFSLVTGKLADKFRSHRVQIFQVAMIGVASSTALISGAWLFEIFVALMVLYGAFDSGFVLLRAVVAEDLVGSDKASRGVGLMFGALGFAYLAGIPLAGWIFDTTQSYPLSFTVASLLSATGCCLLFLIPPVQKVENSSRCTNKNTGYRLSLEQQEKQETAL